MDLPLPSTNKSMITIAPMMSMKSKGMDTWLISETLREGEGRYVRNVRETYGENEEASTKTDVRHGHDESGYTA